MDAELIEAINKLPAAQGRKKAINFARVLADDLKHLETKKLKPLQVKASKFDRIRVLVAEQAAILKHAKERNDDIEELILKLLGLEGSQSRE